MNIALIFAGGVGSRMNSKGKPKQFLELNGKPIIIHTIDHFEMHPEIDAIAVVCVEEWMPYMKQLLEKYHIEKVKWLIKGGATAQESTRNGLFEIRDRCGCDASEVIVLIHDGVRPLINADLISHNIRCVKEHGNAITVVPAIETIIQVNDHQEIQDVADRSRCRLARAPQSFVLKDIIDAHEKAIRDGYDEMIDSATLMRHYDVVLHTIEGPVENIKITNPSDFYIFRALIEAKENSQIWGL